MTVPFAQDLPGREEAQELARRELSRHEYDEARPPWLLRLARALLDEFAELVGRASGAVPGGTFGLLMLTLLLVGLVTLVVLRVRPSAARSRSRDELFGDVVLTAARHREAAEQHAASGRFAEAVRERLRAIVRELESRGVLDPRPGRTVDEVARDAGAAVPTVAAPLQRGATVFDEVWYGGRVADRAAYDVLVEVDQLVTSAPLVRA